MTGALAVAAYGWHAQRTVNPLIDLELLKLATVRTGIVGGSLFRMGMGATPFLLPLMFQLGFGLDPFHSGLITCATAAGAMFMKTLTVAILKRYGFRQVLTVNALLAAAGAGVCGLFTATTPYVIVIAVLLLGGCLRSLQFTALAAVSFADISKESTSQASSMQSMSQRLAQSMGVALGAYALQVSSDLQGHGSVVAADFWPAFLLVALVAAASLLFNLALAPDAGAEISGHARGRKVTSRN